MGTRTQNVALRLQCVAALAVFLAVPTRPAAAQSLRQLTFAPGIDGEPSWSPEGDQIVFDSERAGSVGFDLWVIPVTGGGARQLTSAVSNEFGASWSPDAQTIAYYHAWDGKIHTLPAAGGAASVWTPGNRGESEPAWSPDGTRIAFASTGPVEDGVDATDIWIRDWGTGLEKRLTTHPTADGHPTWSPDGKTIAFVSERGGTQQIWSVTTDGGAPARISELPAIQPAWSPDGQWIAFSADGDIYAISPNGGSAGQVTRGPELDSAPAWSPGSDRIVFMRRSGGEADLWIVDIGPVAARATTWSDMKKRFKPN